MPNNTLLANVPVDLMYQALETEKGGVQIYTTALRLAINKDLREEWNKYLEQTKNHENIASNENRLHGPARSALPKSDSQATETWEGEGGTYAKCA